MRSTPYYDRLMAGMAALRATGVPVVSINVRPHHARALEVELGMRPHTLRVLNGAVVREHP